MSNCVMSGEETSWAQTLVTVTPQDDGYLREIEENVIVSGPADSPLNLDTRNFVLRRSIANNTRDFIDLTELDQSKRIETECQTYLQGVPRVELPLVYREEAAQTVYTGVTTDTIPDGPTSIQYYYDIISVLNDKPLPRLKTTRVVQTMELNDSIGQTMSREFKLSDNWTKTINHENALMEATDIFNFIIERTLWLIKLDSVTKEDTKDVDVQTLITYNDITKKWMNDFEFQTKLTCHPKHSNSMLLDEYTATKEFCKTRINECIENGVDARISIDNIIDEIITKCQSYKEFKFEEKIIDEPVEKEEKMFKFRRTGKCHSSNRRKSTRCRSETEFYRLYNFITNELKNGRCTTRLENTAPCMVNISGSRESSASTSSTSSWRTSGSLSTSTDTSLGSGNEQALRTFRIAFRSP